MYVVCVTSGFTVGSKLYKEGQFFKLTDQLLADYGHLSDEKMSNQQKKIYGNVFFRRPTNAEFKEKILKWREGDHVNGLDPSTVTDKRQKRQLYEFIKSAEYRFKQFADVLREVDATEMEVEETPPVPESAEPVTEEPDVEESVDVEAPKEEVAGSSKKKSGGKTKK